MEVNQVTLLDQTEVKSDPKDYYTSSIDDLSDPQEYYATSTEEFKAKRFAEIEPGDYEYSVMKIEHQIDEIKVEMADTITKGFIDLTKKYGELTPDGYVLDVSQAGLIFPDPCSLKKVSSYLGTVYVTFLRGDELVEMRLEHLFNPRNKARILDMLFYFFEHLS